MVVTGEITYRILLDQVIGHGIIPRSQSLPHWAATRLVGASVWWEDHPRGEPAPAKGYADRIYESGGKWAVDFGANTFLISVAACNCCDCLLKACSRRTFENGMELFLYTRQGLESAIRKAVSNNVTGTIYKRYDGGHGGMLKLGAMSVHLSDFINELQGILMQQVAHSSPIVQAGDLEQKSKRLDASRSDEFVTCPKCKREVMRKNLKRHRARKCKSSRQKKVSIIKCVNESGGVLIVKEGHIKRVMR